METVYELCVSVEYWGIGVARETSSLEEARAWAAKPTRDGKYFFYREKIVYELCLQAEDRITVVSETTSFDEARWWGIRPPLYGRAYRLFRVKGGKVS